jgi:hypothetical protein
LGQLSMWNGGGTMILGELEAVDLAMPGRVLGGRYAAVITL